LVIGQTAQSRWREITKGSLINILLHEIPFVDLHIVSVARELKDQEGYYDKGVRAYLIMDDETTQHKISFKNQQECKYEGIFFKETGTDFNNGVFKLFTGNRAVEVNITDDYATDLEKKLSAIDKR